MTGKFYAMDSRYRYKYTDGDGTVIYFYQDDDGVYRDELGKGLKVELDINNCMYVIDKINLNTVLSKWKFIRVLRCFQKYCLY